MLFSGCETKTFKMLGESGERCYEPFPMQTTPRKRHFEWKIAKGDRVEIIVANQSVGDGDQQLNDFAQYRRSGTANYQTRDGTEGILIPTNGTVRLPLVSVVRDRRIDRE